MDDLISRAAAIGCLGNSPEQMCMPWSEVERILRELPAVDAVPVRYGRWIEKRWTTDYDWGLINHRALVCTACSVEIADGEKTPYCPYCGADMRGDNYEK